jgi:hypothetical protein
MEKILTRFKAEGKLHATQDMPDYILPELEPLKNDIKWTPDYKPKKIEVPAYIPPEVKTEAEENAKIPTSSQPAQNENIKSKEGQAQSVESLPAGKTAVAQEKGSPVDPKMDKNKQKELEKQKKEQEKQMKEQEKLKKEQEKEELKKRKEIERLKKEQEKEEKEREKRVKTYEEEDESI